MEFNQQENSTNSIISIEKDRVGLSHTWLKTPCFISKTHQEEIQISTIEQIDKASVFSWCAKDEVSLLLVGTGESAKFLSAEQQVLIQQLGIGVESMNNAAACRSFNLLLSDTRAVGVVLL